MYYRPSIAICRCITYVHMIHNLQTINIIVVSNGQLNETVTPSIVLYYAKGSSFPKYAIYKEMMTFTINNDINT